jgi:hypothetical protein
MRFKHSWLAVAVAACLAAAGCGSPDDSASFIRDYNRAQEPLRGLVAELETGGAPTGGDAGRFARELRTTATEFDRVRARLGKLDAPAGATDELAKYLSALDSGADEIRRMARAVKQRDPAPHEGDPARSRRRCSKSSGPRCPSARRSNSRRFSGWRDPDSNRGHHDFQSGAGIHRTTPTALLSALFASCRSDTRRLTICICLSWI